MKKAISKLAIFILRFVYFLPALVLILVVAYFLGYRYLQSPQGNDCYNALSIVYWFNRFFPKVPYWYSLQGGGVSFVQGYPLLPSFLVILISRIFSTSLTGSFQVLGFFSLVLTALGIYFFCAAVLKNQTIGLIASILYLLAPATYTWLFEWGFYAESVSYIFFLPALTFFCLYFEREIGKKNDFLTRVYLLGSVLFLSLGFLCHPDTFLAATMVMGIYSLIYGLFKVGKIEVKSLMRAVFPFLKVTLISLLLLSFVVINYWHYQRLSGFLGYTKKEEIVYYSTVPIKPFLGLAQIEPTDAKFTLRNLVLPPSIWILALLGIITSLFLNRKVFSLGIISGLSFIILANPIIVWYMYKIHKIIPLPTYFYFGYRVQLINLKILVPILAAFGAVGWGFWLKTKGPILRALRSLFILLVSFGITLSFLIWFAQFPKSVWGDYKIRYGPAHFDWRNPFNKEELTDLCDEWTEDDPERPNFCSNQFVRDSIYVRVFKKFCQEGKVLPEEALKICDGLETGGISQESVSNFIAFCQKNPQEEVCSARIKTGKEWFLSFLDQKNWPTVSLQPDFKFPLKGWEDFVEENKDNWRLRIDISPKLGGLVQSINMISLVSQINLYTSQLSLLNPYWGYQQEIFYAPDNNNPTPLTDLAKWFGIKYVFLLPSLDPVEKYQKDPENWQLDNQEQGRWEFKNAPELYSWTAKKPVALLIGNEKKRAFEPFFRVGNYGGFSYDDGWLVQGKENIDDYSLKELKDFDLLILFGYSYKKQNKAWDLIDRYLVDGGRVFLSTGWQFTDRDWQGEDLPGFFPSEKLEWTTSLGKSANFKIEEIEEIDPSKFSPLIWADQPWGVSLPSGNLRGWAEPVLTVEGKPLVVKGEYKKGRIVWTGLNLIGHISTYDYNSEEIKFLESLFSFLTSYQGEADRAWAVDLARPFPDRLEFTFKEELGESSTLFWREAQHPDWRAQIQKTEGGRQKTEKLKIYQTGPNLMLIKLPQVRAGEKLVLEYKIGWWRLLAGALSILTLTFLLLYLFQGKRLFSPIDNLKEKLFLKYKLKVSRWWEQEDEI